MAGSYTRMLVKTAQFNEIRQEKNAIKSQYKQLEQVAQEKQIQVASLGSLASEVSALYGLKSDPTLATVSASDFDNNHFSGSIDQLYTLKASAYSGAASAAVSFGTLQNATASDWQRLAAAPSLWPVEGPVTGSFGERSDPFSGEGAFHSGIDISSSYGNPIIAPADGIVTFASDMSGYGHVVMIDHGHGISTRFGHMSGFTVASGQSVHKGETIGYVGLSGRSTGPHLHYEVRIYDTPVNPYKYLRTTFAQSQHIHTGM
jgi:murein DD-endopeptidase MepM/ murein hydrolase activator NlpD